MSFTKDALEAPVPAPAQPQAPVQPTPTAPTAWRQPGNPPTPAPAAPNALTDYVWPIASLASGGACAYHGYRRHNGSIGWAIWWSFCGGAFPIFAPAVALAQGFGKPKGAPGSFASQYPGLTDDAAEALYGHCCDDYGQLPR